MEDISYSGTASLSLRPQICNVDSSTLWHSQESLAGRSTGQCRIRDVGEVPGYAWELARRYPEVILVEGLLDYAVLWQAGFHNVSCAMGTHLNARQFQQLCDGPRTVNLSFDADANGSANRRRSS